MILFNTDGNPDIGSGHVMRCLSIADEAGRMGIECLFVSAEDGFRDAIEKRGHGFICTNTDYWDPDPSNLCSIIADKNPARVVVDSYYVSKEYLKKAMSCAHEHECRLMYVDDLVSYAYPCDILLNYNIYGPDERDEYRKLYSSDENHVTEPEFLLGTGYAPLRREFQSLPKRVVREDGRDILISTGGADPERVALDIIRRTDRYPEYKFHFVVGAFNNDRNEIIKCANACKNAVIHENVTDMCGLMQSVDAAVSAAGSTLYELCATQTPTITYILADNQIKGAEGFKRHGIMRSAGDIRMTDRKKFIDMLLRSAVNICGDYEGRMETARRMASLVDGSGCKRIVEALAKGI